ncbi:hypothetical protein SAMN02745157_1477 [Kaistia soli DSM 19436]|uniref:Uncharacterized protein n=1 Tax=Kaistia soli DSM 19436 TaxID=1122133 RepID=A0A1M4YBL6_9HYPH|nr:hypothetical protein [Kaistia soli]SHF03130.1 hypothetical protein SAMN02745157_1477 [Kaistia soli DSM 19436]
MPDNFANLLPLVSSVDDLMGNKTVDGVTSTVRVPRANITNGASPADIIAVADRATALEADLAPGARVMRGGANIASAASIDLGAATGDFAAITGTTTIASLGTAPAGIERTVYFTGVLTLTHSGTLVLPTGANITTAVGDVAVFRSHGSGAWRCVSYMRADGNPVTGSMGGKVDKTTTVSASGMASGGGALDANRTITVTAATDAEILARTANKAADARGVGVLVDAAVRGLRQNRIPNAYFTRDLIGQVLPYGYTSAFSSSGGGVLAASAIAAFANKPLKTANALKVSSFYNGTNKTDFQLRSPIFTVPDALAGDTTATVRYVCQLYLGSANVSVTALSSGYANADGTGTTYTLTPTKISTDVVGGWATVIFDVPISNAAVRSLFIALRLMALTSGGNFSADSYVVGMFADFNRSDVDTPDFSAGEQLVIDAGQVSPAIGKPHLLGGNRIRNPLFTADPVGASYTGPPSEYTVGIGSGFSLAPWSIVSTVTPFKTKQAFRASISYDGTTKTEVQLRQTVDLPPDLVGDTTAVARLIFYVKVDDLSKVALSIVTAMLNDALASQGTPTPVKRSSDGPNATWFPIIYDIPITVGTTTKLQVFMRLSALSTAGNFTGTIDVTGVFLGFNRPEQTVYDKNADYDAELAAKKALPNIASNSAAFFGSNKAKNALFMGDAIGLTAAPAGWALSSGGTGATKPNTEIVATQTPWSGVEQALRVYLTSTGAAWSDLQPRQTIAVPRELQGRTDAVLKLIFFVRADAAQVAQGFNQITGLVTMYDASGVSLGSATITKVSTDNLVADTWFPVIITAPITNASARSLLVSARVQTAHGAYAGGLCDLTGFFMGFNRPELTTFERNLNDDIDQRAKVQALAVNAGSSNLTRVSTFDQYSDILGNILPMIPDSIINCPGDSLTDLDWAAVIAAAYAAAGQTRTVRNLGIGGEASYEIVNRAQGYQPYVTGITWSTGTIRLRARRAVPARTFNTTYRAYWEAYGARIAEPTAVEFFNANGRIGKSFSRLSASGAVSGATITANGHPFANGDTIFVRDAVVPTGMYKYKPYYVRDVTTNTFAVAEVSGGAAITFTSAVTVTFLGDFYLDWDYTTGVDHTITAVTHTNWDKSAQITMASVNTINKMGSPAADLAQLKADTRALIAQLKTLSKRFLILTLSVDASWTIGTPEYDTVMAYNAWVLAEYPNNSADLYAFLRTLGDGSANDNADIAAGIIPRSLRVDSVHWNNATTQVGNWIYSSFLAPRGW